MGYYPYEAHHPQFSYSGTSLLYHLKDEIWVVSLDGEDIQKHIGTGDSACWLPGSPEVSFLCSAEDGSRSLWLRSVDPMSDAIQISPQGIFISQYAWSPDAQMVAIMSMEKFWEPGRLLLIEASSRTVCNQWELPAYEYPLSLSWSHDGQIIAWDVTLYPDDRSNNANEVRILDVQQNHIKHVVPVGSCQTKRPVWHPHRQELALLATPHPYGMQALFQMAIWNVQGGIARYQTKDPMLVEDMVWAPDGQTMYFSAHNGHIPTHLFALSLIDGSLRQLTDDLADYFHLVLSSDGKWLAAVRGAPDRVSEIYLLRTDLSQHRVLSKPHADCKSERPLKKGIVRRFQWQSVDGLQLDGILLFPPDVDPDQKPFAPLPTIIDIHGGPLHVPLLRMEDHPLRLGGLHELAAQGYLCFVADYRRSGTYGWHHIQKAIDQGDPIGFDAVDILSGIDTLISRGFADPARLGLRGHSHGAFITNWLLTQTGRFRAVVSNEGRTDYTQSIDVDTIRDIWFGGTPQEIPERYSQFSPSTYTAQVKTPTLLIYGEQGFFAQEKQGEIFKTALQHAGVEVELLLLPGEGHWMVQPDNIKLYNQKTLAWFDKYLKGLDLLPS
ncbi:S9 family peptidase [Tengunoibacter tsumagoiensis]|uniref:Peptidase S9 n=1 Tax=Tengunoibacter tsumagoiensis TaxID=2014871 RepID=A0A401ZY50_9CHLR|nr:prolyl oligopeptidase family serine peptidase [Tengunoibacter tsumagoiensis]GCE11762.1 peptidase S9 [Tengunoibacter tsumagoiensis]